MRTDRHVFRLYLGFTCVCAAPENTMICEPFSNVQVQWDLGMPAGEAYDNSGFPASARTASAIGIRRRRHRRTRRLRSPTSFLISSEKAFCVRGRLCSSAVMIVSSALNHDMNCRFFLPYDTAAMSPHARSFGQIDRGGTRPTRSAHGSARFRRLDSPVFLGRDVRSIGRPK